MNKRLSTDEHRLFDAACSGQLDADSHAVLQRVLRDSEEVRVRYLDYLALHSDLFGAVRAARVRERFLATIGVAPQRTSERRRRYRVVGAVLATAAALTLVLNAQRGAEDKTVATASQGLAAQEGEGSWRGLIARVNRVEAVEWQPGCRTFVESDLIAAGEAMVLRAGILEVEFRQGAVVVLEGPAHLVADDANAASLLQGRLAAVAPPWATGFRVDTPGVDVVDHGTEFAVNVSGAGADARVNVVVTEGEVEVLADQQVDGGRRLLAGEGVNATEDAVEDGDDAAARKLTEQLPDRPELKNAVVVGDRWSGWAPGSEGQPCRESAWRYFTNRDGEFGDVQGYKELVWHEADNCYRPADRETSSWFSQHVRVHRDGGHPGRGRDQVWDKIDRYSITGFVVPEDGVYRIEAGWLERMWAKRWDRDEMLDIAVHVNDGPVLMREFCNRDSFVAFRQALGELSAGDTIYVGVGPNGADFNDKFRWGFYVVRETSPPGGATAPNEGGLAATD
ncbi:MAG: FecR domain-containing protein [Planctomycetota bacterium]